MSLDGDVLVADLPMSAALVDAFARWTGDRSSLHLDPAFARRSRFRDRVAHGMIAVAGLLALQSLHPDEQLRFRALKGQFLRPVGLTDVLRMRVQQDLSDARDVAFRATWERESDGVTVTRVDGTYARVPPASGPAAEPGGMDVDSLCERDEGVASLQDTDEVIRWRWGSAAGEEFKALVLEPMGVRLPGRPCPNLLATVMLSPLVGMRLPGRRATFLGFDLSFERDLAWWGECALAGTVTEVQGGTDVMRAAVRVDGADETVAAGRVEVLVNAPPTRMPDSAALAGSAVDLGLRDKVALVMGGSRGIGETTAKLLALLGARVTLTYFRGQADAEAIVADIREAGGVADCASCDVRDEGQVSALVRRVMEREDRVDILVNCAVHDFAPAKYGEQGWEAYLHELDVSVKGLHTVCGCVVPVMRRARGGKIINFSSVAVRTPVSGQNRYITAKAAVEGYTRSLAFELAGSNIQVNLVIPGMTETDLVSAIPANYRERIATERASGRHVRPEEVAQAVAFLASDWSNAMSGQALILNLGEPPYA